MRDTEAKGHPLIDSQKFDAESQDASCDEVPSQDCRIGHAAPAPLISTHPSSPSPIASYSCVGCTGTVVGGSPFGNATAQGRVDGVP